MFFQDVVDRVECETCGAAKGELCTWDESPELVIFSHAARYAAHRVSLSDEEFVALGENMLRKYKDLEQAREGERGERVRSE